MDTAVDGILTIDASGVIETVNPATEHIFGYSAPEMIGQNVSMLMPEPYRSEHDQYLENYLETGVRKIIGIGREVVGRRKDGTTFPLELAVSETRLPDRLLFTGIVRDITERKRDEERIREAAERLRAIVDTAVDGIITIDRGGVMETVNPAAERIFGYSAREMVGRNVAMLMPEPYHSEHDQYLRNYTETGIPKIIGIGREVVGRRKDGSVFPMELAVSETRLPDQMLFTGLVRDISERKRLEEADRFLAEASVVLSSTLDVTALAELARLATRWRTDFAIAHLVDSDGDVRCVGLADTDASGGRGDLLRSLIPPGHPGDPTRRLFDRPGALFLPIVTDEMLRRYAATPDHLRILRALAPQSLILAPLRIRDRTLGVLTLGTVQGGKPPLLESDLSVVQELTRRAALALDNARLFQQAEAASRAKSQFLGVMSHELRTPLGGIIGFADLLQNEIAGSLNGKQKEQVSRIKAAAWHLVSIIEGILTYTRAEIGKEEVKTEAVDAVHLAREALALVESEASSRPIELRASLPSQPLEMRTDPGKVRQILINLLGNAVKFTEAGVVELGLSLESDWVTFRVADQGPGIPPEYLDRIFDPFIQVDQTTTRIQGGTGLGLAVTQRLVQLLGGEVSVESEVGRGSAFTVRLPRNGAPTAARHGTGTRSS